MVCQPCSAKLSGVQAPSLWLLRRPPVPPSCGSRWLTSPCSFQTVGRRKGTKPKCTHHFCSHPCGQNLDSHTPCKRCQEVEALFWASVCPPANQRFSSPGENHPGKQPRAPSKITESSSGENRAENPQLTSSTGALVVKTWKHLHIHW